MMIIVMHHHLVMALIVMSDRCCELLWYQRSVLIFGVGSVKQNHIGSIFQTFWSCELTHYALYV